METIIIRKSNSLRHSIEECTSKLKNGHYQIQFLDVGELSNVLIKGRVLFDECKTLSKIQIKISNGRISVVKMLLIINWKEYIVEDASVIYDVEANIY